MGEAVDTIPSIPNKCLFVSPDRPTDRPTDKCYTCTVESIGRYILELFFIG